jgi:hypothetical protein
VGKEKLHCNDNRKLEEYLSKFKEYTQKVYTCGDRTVTQKLMLMLHYEDERRCYEKLST